MVDVYIGAGSNIGPVENLRLGVAVLAEAFGPARLSSVYRGKAVGFEGDDFLNLVLTFPTEASVERLLKVIEAAHERAGRRRQPDGMGSRTLDLDLLLYGSRIDPEGRLPREDVLRYSFVLQPLAELAPELVHPGTGKTMAEHWASFQVDDPLTQLGPLELM